MEIQLEKKEIYGTAEYTYTKGVVYDEDGFRLTHPPYDSNTLDGLACLTGNDISHKYYHGKLVEETITLSAKQVRGLRYLGLKPYYVKNSGKVNAVIWYI